MTDTDLRDSLAAIAGRVHPADLYERSLRRSRQLSRRRVASTITTGALALALAAVIASPFLPDPHRAAGRAAYHPRIRGRAVRVRPGPRGCARLAPSERPW